MLQFVCTEVTQLFDYPYAWIGKKQDDGTVSMAAWAGNEHEYHEELKKIGVRWDDTPEGQGPVGNCIRSNRIVKVESGESCFLARWNATIKNGFKTVVGIPLVVDGQVYGAFALYSQDESSFDAESLQRLQGIAWRICVAIEMSIAQERLHLLGTALVSAGNGVFITNQRGRIEWVNHSFTRLTGYSAEEAIGQTPSLLKSGKQMPPTTRSYGKPSCGEKYGATRSSSATRAAGCLPRSRPSRRSATKMGRSPISLPYWTISPNRRKPPNASSTWRISMC